MSFTYKILTIIFFSITTLVPTTLWAKRLTRTFGKNRSVRVISDKGFSYPESKKFEAAGNVVISYQNDAIYGEKATLDMLNNRIVVVGNVRFIGKETTFYGSKLFYDLDAHKFQIFNARVLSDDYIVLGKKIVRNRDSRILAEGAEYTTCQDCPESWTIYGNEVSITPHKYIHIKHAYLKAKGIVFMYIPYVVFPIKTKRETGLLVPKFSFESNEGLYFQQPFFWAINRTSDLTLTPSYFGERGFGSEFEYRKVFSPDRWIQLNTLLLNDKIYIPNNNTVDETTLSGNNYFRHYSTLEYHFDVTQRLQHHTLFTFARDADMSRIFNKYLADKELGSEHQVKTTLDYRGNLFQFDAMATFHRNLIFQKSDAFDSAYVQQVPRISFNMLPWTLYFSDRNFLHHVSFGFNFDYIHFKQNTTQELTYYRNAERYSFSPYLNFSWGDIGPVVFNSKIELDGQKYNFPTHVDETFQKYSTVLTNEASIELEKIWGNARSEKRVMKQKIDPAIEKTNQLLIGSMPEFEEHGKSLETIYHNAYKHSQKITLKHHYTTKTRWKGSKAFYNQVQEEQGGFDYKDTFVEKTYLLSDDISRTSIPLSNTFELKWDNSLVKKSVNPNGAGETLQERFFYERIAYLSFSQGYVLDQGEAFKEHLTRLKVVGGVYYNSWSFSFSEYYFYTGKGHIFDIGLGYNVDNLYLSASYSYNYFSLPINRRYKLLAEFSPLDMLSFDVRYDYDAEQNLLIESRYRIIYSPMNNCWKLALGFQKTLVKSSYAVNFLFNFGGGKFSSFE